MPFPYTISATLSYPMDEGLAATEIPTNASGTASHEVKGTLVLVGAGTQSVDFGSIAVGGAKVVNVEVDPDPSQAASPVQVQFNGGGVPGQLEISPGGSLLYTSPNPSAGILSMSIVHTNGATVRYRILG